MNRTCQESTGTTRQKKIETMNTVKQRKLEYLGHIIRNEHRYRLLQLLLQGKVNERKVLKNLRIWYSAVTTGLFRTALNKIAKR